MRYKVNDPEVNNERYTANDSILSWQYEAKGKRKLIKNGRKLAIIIGVLTVIVVGLLVTLALQISIFHKEKKYNEMCQTEECVRTAARIIDAMNRSIDPCQDFYKFACSGWVSKNPIPQSQTSWDQLSFLKERLLENLRILLEETGDEHNNLRPVKLARDLYKTCMNTSKEKPIDY